MTDMPKTIVLAYSGGLDTSTVLKWLQENYDAEIIAFYADIGQMEDLHFIKSKAQKIGAREIYIKDLKEEFITDYAFKVLKAGALYEGKYPLSSSLSRPLIVKEMVSIAEKEKAYALAHGASGKGNDQLRFYSSMVSLNPGLEMLTPVIDWPMKSRDEQIEYAQAHNIDIPVTKEAPYSIDRNLWGGSIECGPLEDISVPPPEEIFQITRSPEKAPDKPTTIEISFEQGVPYCVDGKTYSPIELISLLNEIGGENGVGRLDLIENRVIGIKTREVYECPGAVILFTALSELQALTLDKDTLNFKRLISQRYAELVYGGLWFSPLKEALDAFVDQINKYVTGTVKLKLYKGNCTVVARESDYSLYQYSLSTYDPSDIFDHKAGKGFSNIWGLPLKTISTVRKSKL